MLLIFFEKNYFLLALGWGIINSFGQAGILWMLYKLISPAKNTASVFKYHLSSILLTTSFLWFLVTTVQCYFSIKGNNYASLITLKIQWPLFYQNFSSTFQFISAAYLLFLGLYIIKFGRRYNSLIILKNSQFIKAPAAIRVFAEETATHIGIPKKVKVWLSKNVEVPCVAGYFKPLILLPFSAVSNLSTSQVEAIILHELAHIKRNDYLANLVQSIMELIMFFNPFVLLLGKAAREERENCCDDWVLNYQFNKQEYAMALMMLESLRQQPLQLAIAATNNKKQLLARVKRLFTVSPVTAINNSHRWKLTGISAAILLLLTMFLPSVYNEQPVQYSSVTQPVKMLNSSIHTFSNTAVSPEELSAQKIVNDQMVAASGELIKSTKKEIKKSIRQKIKEVEYSETLINEELIKANHELQNLSIQVSDNEEVPEQAYLIKVEEEISGSKEKKSYLLEYKKVNGKVEINPLIILNKTKAKIASSGTKVSKAKAAQITISSRKKITS